MRWIPRLRLRFRSLLRNRQVDQELEDELRYHLERQIEENLAAGMPPEEARYAALRAMGGVEQRREECRDTRGWRWLEDFVRDLHFALRTLSKSPSFTAVAVASLALGIGVNSAVFSAVNALLLRSLPYPHPDRLVSIEEGPALPGVHFVDWKDHSRTLDAIAAYSKAEVALTGVGEPQRLSGFYVSESFFPTLGTSMLLGRNFLPAEGRAGGEHVVILSHGLWQNSFGSDQAIVGRSVRIDDEGFRVIGVLPQDFRFFLRSDFWVPLAIDYQQVRGRQQWLMQAIGRLKPGVTLEQAAAELETIKNAYASPEQKNAPFSKERVQLTPLYDHLVGGTRRLLLILLGAVALILLIACANVANLMLARGVVRQKELAIRAALGAGQFRLVRQLLTESLMLALTGAACGLFVAWGLTKWLIGVSPPDTFGQVARLAPIGVDGRVLVFTVFLSLLSGVLFGVAPALQFSHPQLTTSLKDGGRGPLFPRQRTLQALLVAQVALAIVLLIGAGLLIRSFVNLLRVDPGFRADSLLTVRISLPYRRYAAPERRAQFQRQLLQSVANLPGVERVGAITDLPFTGYANHVMFRNDGRPNAEAAPPTPLGMVSPDYFRTLGIALRAGRFFDDRDAADAPGVAILSESLARQLFPDQDSIGRKVPLPCPPAFPQCAPTIVGVVDDVKHQGLDKEAKPELYFPYQQAPIGLITLAVRTSVEPHSVAGAVRKEVLAIDAQQPVYDVMTMEQRLDDSVAPRRFTLLVLGTFAVLALLLASVGVYGVITYLATQRRHEVGIRMALGARGSDVLRLFVKQGMSLVVWGVVIGLLGAMGLTRVMTGLLFGTSPADPLTFVTVALLLTLIALAACWLPARRATAVHPLVALRHE